MWRSLTFIILWKRHLTLWSPTFPVNNPSLFDQTFLLALPVNGWTAKGTHDLDVCRSGLSTCSHGWTSLSNLCDALVQIHLASVKTSLHIILTGSWLHCSLQDHFSAAGQECTSSSHTNLISSHIHIDSHSAVDASHSHFVHDLWEDYWVSLAF